MLNLASQDECQTCGGMGIITYNVPVGHEFFGRGFPCPEIDCLAGHERRQKAYSARFKSAGIPARYQPMTFGSFDQYLNERNIDYKGKRMAYGAARLFARYEPFTLNEAALEGGQNLAFMN